MIESLIAGWDGVGVVTTRDAATDAWIFIALHDGRLGPMVGGTRIKVYPGPDDGLRDALRLAEGMTHKWAAINFPFGGGKAVLALTNPVSGDARMGLLRRYGEKIAALRGAFLTGQDLGTTPEDMRVIAEAGPYVNGVDAKTGHTEDPGPYTARGVFAGIRAAVRHRFGSDDLSGRRVLVQGVGDVGAPLARRLAKAGAVVLCADLNGERAAALAKEVGGEVVEAEAVTRTSCDIYAPCAVGATLNVETIPTLACAIVAGSANNQLGEAADADRLAAREILYVPDYVINSGGAVGLGLQYMGIADHAKIGARLDAIGETVAVMLREADQEQETPAAAARRLVERHLRACRPLAASAAADV